MTELSENEWKRLAVDLGIAFDAQEKRIKTLELAMQEFVETTENAGDYHEQNAVALSYYLKFKKLLPENEDG